MQLKEYEKIIEETDVSNHTLQFYLDGMSEESGEINGVLKRVRRGDYDTGKDTTDTKVSEIIERLGLNYVLFNFPDILNDLLDEMGDREWYTQRFLNNLGLTFEDLMERNAKKVIGRKKNGTILGKGDKRK